MKSELGGEKTLPTILIMENVKALLSSNGGWDFARVLIEMDKVGYDAEWAVLNSSDVVPQNRERVYIIGHLRGTSTRQVFPIQRQGTDFARTNPKIRVVGNTSSTDYKSQNVISSNGISPTLTATDYKHPKQVAVRQVGNIVKQKGFSNPQRGRIYSINGLSPTLNTAQGGGLEPKVLLDNAESLAIRKLTPKECWRLQGFSDKQFDKAKQGGISNSQLYKQAGNAVTVDVIEQIGKRLVLEDDEAKRSSDFGINYKN